MATTKWQYVGQMLLPSAVPSAIIDKWAADLSAQQAGILSRLTSKVPDNTAFQADIVTPSSSRYADFLATVGGAWDRDTILMKQKAKLGRSYTQWLAGINAVFGSGGTFPTTVNAKKGKYDLARYTLGVTGVRYIKTTGFGVWNPATVGALLMRGDTRPFTYFDANDAFTPSQGNLENVCDSMKGAYGSPALIADTVRCSVLSKFCDEAGLTTLRDNIITATNARIDDIVNMMLNATHKGTGYDVTWVIAWNSGTSLPQLTVLDSHP